MSEKKSTPSDSIQAYGILLIVLGAMGGLFAAMALENPLTFVVIAVPAALLGVLVILWGGAVKVNEQIRDLLSRDKQP